MNGIRRFFRIAAGICLAFSIVIMAMVVMLNITIPANFYVVRSDRATMPDFTELTGTTAVGYSGSDAVNAGNIPHELDLRLFGIIPIKQTSITPTDRVMLTPGGTPFGIKLFTRGVMVIGINNVETYNGVACPAKLAGILKGDVLLSMNSAEVTSNEQVADIIAKSGGNNVILTLERNHRMIKTILTPVVSEIDGQYKSGLWVRDSSAGIGTVTYYDDDLQFGGLGHGICDVDTGKIMPLSSGEVCAVRINSVQKGKAGTPGELRGGFTTSDSCGSLYNNNESGIFGKLDNAPNMMKPIPIMLKQEVHHGAAKIICTTDSSGPRDYDILIEKVDLNPQTVTKNMVITVTDPDLLARTGGIVQGMSGSPIIQDGKLVGAVTHVFVNNPQKGYGIFIENMLANSNDTRLRMAG